MKSARLRQYDGDPPDFTIEVTDYDLLNHHYADHFDYLKSVIRERIPAGKKAATITTTRDASLAKYVVDVFLEDDE